MSNARKHATFLGIVIILITLLFSASSGFANSPPENITIVYTGNLDGELEPCGCSEGGDKGGLKRRAQGIDELRAEDPNLFLISSGGLLISEIQEDKLKSQYILKGMTALDYDAIGVQWRDLAFGKDFLTKHKLPLVISNSDDSSFSQKIIFRKNKKELAYFSWLNPTKNMQEKLVFQNTAKLKQALAEAKNKNQLTTLATTYSLKSAQKKLPLENVDVLIIRSKYELYGEPQQIGNMLVIQPGSRGMRLGKIDISVNAANNITDWKHTVIPLPPEVKDAPRMQAWYDEYNVKVKEDYEKATELRKALETGESPFAGADTCQSCHQKQHAKWKDSRHADAFYTLQDAGKAFDPNCIICHTVGFKKPGGFLDAKLTENLMHVQCENCHGAAKEHANSGGQIPVSNAEWPKEKMCGQCHVQKHSADFVFDKYWPKIEHPN